MPPETTLTDMQCDALAWDKQAGLLPAVVQDADTLRVLMLGYMDRAALQATLATGKVTFYSRSRQCAWVKGETSGNVLTLVGVEADCDADTLLVTARPQGPTCHLDRASCFPSAPADFLAELDVLVAERERDRPCGSYTTRLFDSGVRRIAQNPAALVGESADLLYHLLVLLRARGLSLAEVTALLRERHRG